MFYLKNAKGYKMKCRNCQNEMENYFECFWCSECGTLYYKDTEVGREWQDPKSVDNTKKLVQELINARNKASYNIAKVNRMIDEQREDIGYDDSRDR